jgi:hypothetical protein
MSDSSSHEPISDAHFAAELARRLNALIGTRWDAESGCAKRDAVDKVAHDAWCLVQAYCVDLAQAVDGCGTLLDHPTIIHREVMVDDKTHQVVGLCGLLNGCCGEAVIYAGYTDAALVAAFFSSPTRAVVHSGELPIAALPRTTIEGLARK